MTTRSRLASGLAALAGLLVLVRVIGSSARNLVTAPGIDVVTVATVVLLVAAVAFVAASAWVVVEQGVEAQRAYARALVGFVVVMAGYLGLGLAVALTVPWTAYAVLVAVTGLGGAAVVLHRRGG